MKLILLQLMNNIALSKLLLKKIVNENINLTFNIDETEKFYVKKLLFGNNVTSENVIRIN